MNNKSLTPSNGEFRRRDLELGLQVAGHRALKIYERLQAIKDPIRSATDRVEGAKRAVFAALVFVNSPTWNDGLKLLQDDFNSEVTSCHQTILKVKQQLTPEEARIKAPLEELYNEITLFASDINTAIGAAIMDGGLGLRHLAENDAQHNISGLVDERFASLSTDALLTQTRISRAGVYIGKRCNDLEAQGIKKVRQQVRVIYRELEINSDQLTGDKKEAWEYLKGWNPFSLTGSRRERFEDNISSYKRIVASKIKGG